MATPAAARRDMRVEQDRLALRNTSLRLTITATFIYLLTINMAVCFRYKLFLIVKCPGGDIVPTTDYNISRLNYET